MSDEVKSISSLAKVQEKAIELSVVFSSMVIGSSVISSVSDIASKYLNHINDLSIVLLSTSASVAITSNIQKKLKQNKIIKNHASSTQISKWKDISKNQSSTLAKSWVKAGAIASLSACIVYTVPMSLGVASEILIKDASLLMGAISGVLSFSLSPSTYSFKKERNLIFNDVMKNIKSYPDLKPIISSNKIKSSGILNTPVLNANISSFSSVQTSLSNKKKPKIK